jgi:dTDP-4-dehydrorhamnose 3,5-epimerase-like enzyme
VTNKGHSLKERMAGSAELLPVECKLDDRGFLYQIYGTLNRYPKMKRVYAVGNHSRGTIRGLHKHKGEYKFYFAVTGSAKFVVESQKKGKPVSFVLSPRRPAVLVVPPGLFHGWTSLEENTVVIGMSNYTLSESERDDIRKDPFAFGREVWETKPR